MSLKSYAVKRACALACAAVLTVYAAAQSVDLPDYVPTRQVAGTIRISGSPQMGDLLQVYEQGFAKRQPAVHFDNQLTSTLAAVGDVASGNADIVLLGREIWPSETQAFEARLGHTPSVIEVATGSYDVPKATFALMIFVSASNPIASLSTSQLERIFAASDAPIRTWGDLGLNGEWAARPIHLYGFPVDNDKSQIFKQVVFGKGERWSLGLKQFSNVPGQHGADAGELIVQAVENDPAGIGISNVHYSTPGVKALALSTLEGGAPIAPTRENVASRRYPLTRAVYMVMDSDPVHPAGPAVVEFMRYVLSRRGQQAVMQEGNYLPLPPEVAERQIRQLTAGTR